MSSAQIGFSQVALLMKKFEKVGWDSNRLTQLGQANAKKFRAIEAVLDGASLDTALKAAASVSSDSSHLRFLQSVAIAPTTGSTTLAQAGDVFTGYLDPDFKRWGTDVAGVDTAETPADIYEMKKDGTYAQFFGSIVGASGSYDEIVAACRPLCWQQGQVLEFARTHRTLLRQGGYATFFLFEVNGEVLVARARVDGGQLRAFVSRFADGIIWSAVYRRRVVVPQLSL